MLDGKMGKFGAEKVKKHGSDWQQGYGGGVALVKAPEEQWGKMGGNGGNFRKNGETKPVHPSPLIFVICPTLAPPARTTPHFPPLSPIPPPFSPISPHLSPFPPISPCFSWYWVHYGYVAGYIATHLVRVFLRPAFLPDCKKYTHAPPPQPPKGTKIWRIDPKAHKTQDKCQNPPSWCITNVPERYGGDPTYWRSPWSAD